MTVRQLDLLCRIKAGLHPLAGVVGRQVGVVCRQLERLRLAGYLRHHRRSRAYRLTARARAIMGGRR